MEEVESKEEIYGLSSFELNKKRKLQGEHLGIPSSKHKFGDRFYGALINSTISDDGKYVGSIHDHPDEVELGEWIGGRVEECESVKDSHSYEEESESGTLALGLVNKKTNEVSIRYTVRPSISSSSSSVQNYSNNHHLSSSIAITSELESTYGGKASNLAVFGGASKLEREFPSPEDHINEPEMNYHNLLSLDEEIRESEQNSDLFDEDTMLYSNGVISNSYVLSSGRWTVNPESRLGARKPTIDQEFEQYFSKLML